MSTELISMLNSQIRCIKFLEFEEEMSVFFQIHWDAKLYEVNSLRDFPIDAKIVGFLKIYILEEEIKSSFCM